MPRIIDKKFDALMDEELKLADNYTPEWKPSQDDAGLALLKIFTHMREEIISRLNRVPDKNLTAFFDMIGAKLLLPLSAKVPVTFYPTEGTFNSVFVPRGTEVAAPKNDNHETLTYQTMTGFSATKASIIEILSVDPKNDAIYSHKDDLNKNTIELFKEKNQQKHTLYLGHSQLFNIKPSGEITLAFKLANDDGFDLKRLKWRYWDGVDWVEPKIPVQESDGNPLKITLIIGKDKDGKLREIKEREINNINSMWISCSLDDDQKESARPHAEFERIFNEALNPSNDLFTLSFQEIWVDKVATDSESAATDSQRSPDLIAYNFTPLDPRPSVDKRVYPFGCQPRLYDSFYLSSRDAFSKKNAIISIEFKANGKVGQKVFNWNNIPGKDMEKEKLKDFLIKNYCITWVKEAKIEKIDGNNIKIYTDKEFILLKLNGDKTELSLELNDKIGVIKDKFIAKNENGELNIYVIDNPEVEPLDGLTLVPKYWNGTFWNFLKVESDLNGFKKDSGSDYRGNFKFVCPEDIQETEVNGARNFWIRIRITAGNYGAEQLVSVDRLNNVGKELEKISTDVGLTPDSKESLLKCKEELCNYCKEFKSVFFPPWITAINISYALDNSHDKEKKYHLERCIAYNNLEYIDFTADSRGDKDGGSHDGFFRPFIPLVDVNPTNPTVYVGFDSSLGNGNISIFFSVPEENRSVPDLKWHCWCAAPGIIKSEGSELTLESTDGLSSQTELLLEKHFDGGTIREYAVVEKIPKKNVIKLDRTLHHDFSRSSCSPSRILKKVILDVLDGTEGLARSDSLVLTMPPDHLSTTHFGKSCTWIMGIWAKEKPKGISISSIFPNTAWAEQVETISDEIIGSSDGEKGQEFRFARSPVISPQLWVKESSKVAEDDRQFIQSDGLKTSEVTDEDGKITDVWVLWKAVEDFYDSGPRNRHYMVDEALGRINFGDGTRGMIPPIGTDNLRASYNTGGGMPGNIAAGEITTIKTPISGIDKVSNPLPADGGSDIEDLGSAQVRGPLFIKSLGRAVTEEDFGSLAKESSSYIARTKCFTKGDRLKVVVIPRSNVEKPMPSPGLLRVVREYLATKMPATLYPKNFDLMGPIYTEIRISATVVPRFRDDSVALEGIIIKRLKEYLHPLWGGRDKAGWPFGRGIHISELYELLESIDGVDYVDYLKIIRPDRQEESFAEQQDIEEWEMVCSGEHSIAMNGGAEK